MAEEEGISGMSTINIAAPFAGFDPHHPVSGAYFIGRHAEKAYFRERIFDAVMDGRCVLWSITGMNRIGKSSLIKELCSEFLANAPKNVIILNSTFEGKNSFWNYWLSGVIDPLSDELDISTLNEHYRSKIVDLLSYFEDNDVRRALLENDVVADTEAPSKIKRLLKLISKSDIRIILIIDEFDQAEYIFDKRSENFSRLRDIFLDDSISVITLSRRRLENIETVCCGASTLDGIFLKYGLFGFCNNDMDEYFARLEVLRGSPLTQEQKRDIWYFCGRSPYYLSVMGAELTSDTNIDTKNNDHVVSVESVSRQFFSTFNRIITLLDDDTLLKPMLQMFKGPIYDLRSDDVNKLISMGYCIKRSESDQYFGDYSDYIDPDDLSVYLTVCDYFVDYLAEIRKAELETIWPKQNTLIKRLRKIIEDEYRLKHGNAWKDTLKSDIIDCSVDKSKSQSMQNRQRKKAENRLDGFSIGHGFIYDAASPEMQELVGNSYMNVCNFIELVGPIENAWNDTFYKYFPDFSKDTFHSAIVKLHKARNPLAHFNGELLTPLMIAEVDDICDSLIKSIDAATIQ